MLYSVHNCYIAGGCRGWYENGSPGLYSINCYIASLACTLVSRCYIIFLHVILHWIMPFISWYIWCSNSLLLHLAGPGPGSPCTTCYITWYTPYSDSEWSPRVQQLTPVGSERYENLMKWVVLRIFGQFLAPCSVRLLLNHLELIQRLASLRPRASPQTHLLAWWAGTD